MRQFGFVHERLQKWQEAFAEMAGSVFYLIVPVRPREEYQ
jgi:hypothetical protein